jgi:hypothetical protein
MVDPVFNANVAAFIEQMRLAAIEFYDKEERRQHCGPDFEIDENKFDDKDTEVINLFLVSFDAMRKFADGLGIETAELGLFE